MLRSFLLKTLVWILGIFVISLSFFFEEDEKGFSTSREIRNEVKKSTHFTRLTNQLRNIYISSMLVFLFVLFAFNKSL